MSDRKARRKPRQRMPVIEDSIPLPIQGGIRGLIRKLRPGQSIFLPQYKETSSISTSRWRVSKETGAKFVTRKVDGGVRLWRVS